MAQGRTHQGRPRWTQAGQVSQSGCDGPDFTCRVSDSQPIPEPEPIDPALKVLQGRGVVEYLTQECHQCFLIG